MNKEIIIKAERHINFTRNSSVHAYSNIIIKDLLDIIKQFETDIHDFIIINSDHDLSELQKILDGRQK